LRAACRWTSALDARYPCTHLKTSFGRNLRWYQTGGGASDRQWRDIQGIIRMQGARPDRAYLREHAPALGIETLLAHASSESE
jgi:hypothetical protein